MDIFLPEHQDFLRRLVAANIDFILVGGYAVIYHGYGRSTGDLDVWVLPEKENWEKVIQVLQAIGLPQEAIIYYRNANLSEPQVIMFDPPPIKVDILTKISLVDYKEAKERSLLRTLNGIPVHVLHLEHLVLSKINTGRTQDKADIDELQRIEKARNKNKKGD